MAVDAQEVSLAPPAERTLERGPRAVRRAVASLAAAVRRHVAAAQLGPLPERDRGRSTGART